MTAKDALTFAGEIFAFLVVIGVIYRYVRPPLGRAMAAQQAIIKAEFDEAREAKEQAEAAEGKYRASIKHVEAEVAEIGESAERLAQQIVDDLRARARDDADRIIARAHQQLAADREALIRGIRGELGAQVVELAGRIVVESLSDDARRAATIDRFLTELEQLAPAAGAL